LEGYEKEKLFDNDKVDQRMSIKEGQLYDISNIRANTNLFADSSEYVHKTMF
jgi:outer membrane protein assembly factor BamA